MSHFTFFSISTGEIKFNVECDPGLVNHYIADDLNFIDGKFQSDSYFIYENVPIALPERPGPQYRFNYIKKQWEDPRTLADLKAAKWEQVKAQRDAAEFGLFQWTGHSFDGDEAAQRRINLAVMGAQAALIAGDTAWSVDWTLADNTSLTLSASDMIGVANALGANIAQAHATARAKRQQIEQATTNGELGVL